MTLKFTPPPAAVPDFALFVFRDERNGTLRQYHDLGRAKIAWHDHCGGYGKALILQRIDGEYYILHEIPAGTTREQLPWYHSVTKHGRYVPSTHDFEPDTVVFERKPLGREEYADWRLKVYREQLAEAERKRRNIHAAEQLEASMSAVDRVMAEASNVGPTPANYLGGGKVPFARPYPAGGSIQAR